MTNWLLGISLIILGAGMSACAMGGKTSWKEEVLLHDGTTIIVERSVERGGKHELGQRPPIKAQRLTFTLPGKNESVTWEDNFTQDVGGASFLPMQLEIRKDTAYLVAYPMGCLSYNKWGRPNPPYVVFKYQDKSWQRIALQELPVQFKTPNLIFSSPDSEAEKTGQRLVSAETVRALYEGYKQPEYKTILREAYPTAAGSCGEMIPYGNAGWLGLDWFSDQPTYEACLKFCEKKIVSPQKCPCARLFKVK
ncbi:MAG: hypothetical protein K0M66_02610 [Thiobacillus sp.]|nr:hypothetical protein [Thiobacillus sp.]